MEDKGADKAKDRKEDSPAKEAKDGRGKGKSTPRSDKADTKSTPRSERPSKVPTIARRVGDGNGVDPSAAENAAAKEGAEKILTEIKEGMKVMAQTFTERMDEQTAQVQFLTNEWNIKTAGSSKKAQEPSYNEWEQNEDSDDERLQEVVDDLEDEEDQEEDVDEDNFDDAFFGKDAKGIMPTIDEIKIFERRTKLSEDYGEDNWREVKAKQVAKFWVGLPGAKKFAGQKADHDAPPLKYKNQNQTEKDLAEMHKFTGAINLCQIRLAEDIQGMQANASITQGKFADPEITMEDVRHEAAQSLEAVKEVTGQMRKTVGSLGKLATYTYLKLLQMRRSQYVESVDSGNAARTMVKRLKPTTLFLFGDKIQGVCCTLKDGAQLSNQLQRGRGAGRGRGFSRGGFRGRADYRGGFRGRSDYRGGFRGGFRRRANKGRADKDG